MSEQLQLLVTVKAYPALSRKHGEVVCVAGVRTDTERPEWVRLFPVPFRDLPFDQRFTKYQIITVECRRPSTDRRPESYQPDPDTLVLGETLPAGGTWPERRALIEPLTVESMCWIQAQQKVDGTSLGVFRPAEVLDFEMEPEPEDWDPGKLGIASQPSLFFPGKKGLQKIPYRFRYVYRCSESDCGTHSQSIVDWELAQSFLSWGHRYSRPVLLERIREKWLGDLCGPDKDTMFYVGNQHQHPESFLVLGVFYPKHGIKEAQPPGYAAGPPT
ncbi:MAG: hypothetical protein HS107_07060 [Thermoflexaceae bacterium]|nr:hypothetical protein [Thermoflexaceae bacterium]